MHNCNTVHINKFLVFSPSTTGPEHSTNVSLVVFRSRNKHRHHPKELQPSAVSDLSVAICFLNPSFKCLISLSVPTGPKGILNQRNTFILLLLNRPL